MYNKLWDGLDRIVEPFVVLETSRDIDRAERNKRSTTPEDALRRKLANAAEGVTFKNRKEQLAHDDREQALEAELASIEQRLVELAVEIMAEQDAYKKMLADPRRIVNSERHMNRIRDLIMKADEEVRCSALAEICKLM